MKILKMNPSQQLHQYVCILIICTNELQPNFSMINTDLDEVISHFDVLASSVKNTILTQSYCRHVVPAISSSSRASHTV
jgi:hypothetical protein